ncbi:MAG: hypothetical protein RSC06_00635 [Clostridia bacterium]
MKYAVKVGTNLSIEMVDATNQPFLGFCYKQIGCDMIEIVRPRGLKRPLVMVIDEEGLLKSEPVINFIGSYLYETHEHKLPIVGNALICKEINNGTDLAFLDEDEAIDIAKELDKIGKAEFYMLRKQLE